MTAASEPVTIYYNPRCSKSRQTLALLRERGIEPRVVEYLKTPPDAATLTALLAVLGLEPEDVTRRGEPAYRDAGLDGPALGRRERIDRMVRHPQVIERPIVQAGERARVGRPPEAVLEIL